MISTWSVYIVYITLRSKPGSLGTKWYQQGALCSTHPRSEIRMTIFGSSYTYLYPCLGTGTMPLCHYATMPLCHYATMPSPYGTATYYRIKMSETCDNGLRAMGWYQLMGLLPKRSVRASASCPFCCSEAVERSPYTTSDLVCGPIAYPPNQMVKHGQTLSIRPADAQSDIRSIWMIWWEKRREPTAVVQHFLLQCQFTPDAGFWSCLATQKAIADMLRQHPNQDAGRFQVADGQMVMPSSPQLAATGANSGTSYVYIWYRLI